MITLIAVVLAIGVVAILTTEYKLWRARGYMDRALGRIVEANPDFDANALRCSLEADRQRRFHDGDDEPPPMALAA